MADSGDEKCGWAGSAWASSGTVVAVGAVVLGENRSMVVLVVLVVVIEVVGRVVLVVDGDAPTSTE
jgi:hypothetical protein